MWTNLLDYGRSHKHKLQQVYLKAPEVVILNFFNTFDASWGASRVISTRKDLTIS